MMVEESVRASERILDSGVEKKPTALEQLLAMQDLKPFSYQTLLLAEQGQMETQRSKELTIKLESCVESQ